MKLPIVSGREAVRRLERVGFFLVRQVGSHLILRRKEPPRTLSVPDHKELKKGTLRNILKQAELPLKLFEELE